MKTILIAYLVINFLLFFSCNLPTKDYVEQEEGVYMQLLSFEDETKNYQPNKFVSAEVRIFDDKKQVYRQFKEELIQPNHFLSFLYKYLQSGDSAVFLIKKNIFQLKTPIIPSKTSNQYYSVQLKIYDYFNEIPKNYDSEMVEQLILKRYLSEHKKFKHKQGIFFQQIKQGKGEAIMNGSNVTIHYTGSFLNQLEFDNTYHETGLTFTYGNPDQVIKGIEIALKGMKEGEIKKIIIPSQLAFGEKGSTTKVVPPFTSLEYKIEIIKID